MSFRPSRLTRGSPPGASPKAEVTPAPATAVKAADPSLTAVKAGGPAFAPKAAAQLANTPAETKPGKRAAESTLAPTKGSKISKKAVPTTDDDMLMQTLAPKVGKATAKKTPKA